MLLKDLQTLATKLATGTLFHVEKAGKAYSVDYSALAKAIIEEYADSTVGGSKQSVQAAIGALNSSVTFLSGGSAAVGDANSITQTGVYKAVNATANTPVTGNHYVIYHATYTDGEAYQMAISAKLRLYIRIMQGSTWSDWQEK